MNGEVNGEGRALWRRLAMPVACLALVLALAACDNALQTKDADAEQDAGTAEIKKGVKPEPDAEAAVLETDFGEIVIELYPNLAPKMVERFKKLTADGYYDGTTFHRINPGLGIIQGGDANSKDANPANDGMGGSDYPDLPAEFSDVPYERGTVGAARSQAVDSANSQFYITLKRQSAFDQRYTVFGRVIRGINNADIISTAPITPGSERPDPKVTLKRATLQPRANFQ
ncbi:MAG TPA: peptidylprolyl isomerase [Pyrinomonadaceae bacterium]|nr:peptidylprolyl isomerase [Pyrinomonadaceae bacterium]